MARGVFRGEGRHKVDAKGRVSVPALFRRVIEACDPDYKEGLRPQLVIVYGDHRRKYLECFTMEAIDKIDRQIAKKPAGKNRKMLERLYHGQSLPTEVDPDGRLVLPQKLRDKIGLNGEAYFVAALDKFQIWNPETYEEENAAAEEWVDSLHADMDIAELLDDDDDDDEEA